MNPNLPDSEVDSLAAVEVATRHIGERPRQFPVVLEDIRRARLRKFPDSLFFRVEQDSIFVIACFHASRDPQHWR